MISKDRMDKFTSEASDFVIIKPAKKKADVKKPVQKPASKPKAKTSKK